MPQPGNRPRTGQYRHGAVRSCRSISTNAAVRTAQLLGIEGVLEFSTDLFDRQTAERMVDGLPLRSFASNRQVPMRRSSICLCLRRRSARRSLKTWNATSAPIFRRAGSIRSSSARSIGRRTEIAVIFGATRLNYASLNRRANRIAHTLRARGVERCGRVGVCLDRSADLLGDPARHPEGRSLLRAARSGVPGRTAASSWPRTRN